MKNKIIKRIILGIIILGFILLIVYAERRAKQNDAWKFKGELHEKNRSINLCNSNGLLIRRIQLLDYS